MIDAIPSENVLRFFRCGIFFFIVVDFLFFLMGNVDGKFVFGIVSLLKLFLIELEFGCLLCDGVMYGMYLID